jgi:hypothetical protein
MTEKESRGPTNRSTPTRRKRRAAGPEEFPVGGRNNKLKVHLRVRNLSALPVLMLWTALTTGI